MWTRGGDSAHERNEAIVTDALIPAQEAAAIRATTQQSTDPTADKPPSHPESEEASAAGRYGHGGSRRLATDQASDVRAAGKRHHEPRTTDSQPRWRFVPQNCLCRPRAPSCSVRGRSFIGGSSDLRGVQHRVVRTTVTRRGVSALLHPRRRPGCHRRRPSSRSRLPRQQLSQPVGQQLSRPRPQCLGGRDQGS